jgi:hypothetical protein
MESSELAVIDFPDRLGGGSENSTLQLFHAFGSPGQGAGNASRQQKAALLFAQEFEARISKPKPKPKPIRNA